MAIPNDLSFVTVMDITLFDSVFVNGKTFTFQDLSVLSATHDLPLQGTVSQLKLSGTIDGVEAVVSTAAGTITLTETLKVVVFDLANGDFNEITGVISGFTLTILPHTTAEVVHPTNGLATYIKPIAFLDSLTISNITEEGPRKEARGGKNARPIVRYGKTMRLEAEDVLFNLDALKALTAADISLDRSEITFNEIFPKDISILGDTYVLDKTTGDKKNVYLLFNSFLPDGILDITMESEGDIGVMSLAGELFPK